MRRVSFILILLVFLSVSATLAAEERSVLGSEKRPSTHGRRPETGDPPGYARPRPGRPPANSRPDYSSKPGDGYKPPRPSFTGRPPRPPGRPDFRPPHNRPRPPQWSISIHNRPDKPAPSWYGGCPPYCGNIYWYNPREEEAGEYFTEESGPPEEPTYFQPGGSFEAAGGEAPPPPIPGEDGAQPDLNNYRLMMKAWQ